MNRFYIIIVSFIFTLNAHSEELENEFSFKDFKKSNIAININGKNDNKTERYVNENNLTYIKSKALNYFSIKDKSVFFQQLGLSEPLMRWNKTKKYEIQHCLTTNKSVCKPESHFSEIERKIQRTITYREDAGKSNDWKRYFSDGTHEEILFFETINTKVHIPANELEMAKKAGIKTIITNKYKILAMRTINEPNRIEIMMTDDESGPGLGFYLEYGDQGVNLLGCYYSSNMNNKTSTTKIKYDMHKEESFYNNSEWEKECMPELQKVYKTVPVYFDKLKKNAMNAINEMKTFEKTYNNLEVMIVAYENNLIKERKIARDNQIKKFNIKKNILNNALRDVYIGKKVLIRSAHTDGNFTKNELSHFQSCSDIPYDLVDYMQVKINDDGKKYILNGNLQINTKDMSELVRYLSIVGEAIPNNLSLDSMTMIQDVDINYDVISSNHESINYTSFNHKVFGKSLWSMAAHTDKEFDEKEKYHDEDFLIHVNINKLLSEDDIDKYPKRNRVYEALKKGLPNGLKYGTCPAEEFNVIKANLSDIKIDKDKMISDVKNEKKKMKKIASDQKRKQADDAARCLRIQRSSWDMYTRDPSGWYQYINGSGYAMIRPFVRSQCNIKLPPGGQ